MVAAISCEATPTSEGGRALLNQDCRATIAMFKQRDPTLKDSYFATAHGWAVFPRVTKGGFVVGGAHGRGQVWEQGEMIGYASVSQGTVGAQVGGQEYAEIIFFRDQFAIDRFKRGEFAFSAQATGVAATAGAAATANYSGGVAVFTIPLAGLMGEASIGGQQFDFFTTADVLARDKPEVKSSY